MKNNHNKSTKLLIAMLAATCLMSVGAEARRLLPESPSVEVRLEALRILQNSAYDTPDAPLSPSISAAPFKPAVNYAPPAPVVAPTPAPVIIAKPVVAPKKIVAKPKLAEVVAPKPVPIPAAPVEKIKKIEKPAVELPPIAIEPAPIKLEPTPIAKEKPKQEKKIEPLKIEELKVEPLKIEKPRLPEPEIKKPAPDVIPLPLEIIEEKSDDKVQTIGKELSLDELLREEPLKVEEVKKIKEPKMKVDAKLAEPEIPELEPDFDDMAKIDDVPKLEELPKNLDELEEIKPLTPVIEEKIELPKIETKTESKPFVELPPEDMPLIDSAIEAEEPVKLPEPIIEEKSVAEPVIAKTVDAKPAEKKGVLPNLSAGFSSFLGGKKAAEKLELPALPTFKEAEPPVDATLPVPDFADDKPADVTTASAELPNLPTFGNEVAIEQSNAPLPTLPFGEKPRLAEQQMASLPKEKLPQITENKAENNGSDMSISFSQSETEVPLSAQKSLIALAKELVASESKNVKITAYASGSADQVSVARRISLARALAVRAFLIDLGVPNTNISVKAMGNDIESGSPERADITVN